MTISVDVVRLVLFSTMAIVVVSYFMWVLDISKTAPKVFFASLALMLVIMVAGIVNPISERIITNDPSRILPLIERSHFYGVDHSCINGVEMSLRCSRFLRQQIRDTRDSIGVLPNDRDRSAEKIERILMLQNQSGEYDEP